MLFARGTVIVVLAGILLAAVAVGPSGAAPRPTSTIILNCARHVVYSGADWPTQAPAIEVYYYDSTGRFREGSHYIYCAIGGGRERVKLNLAEDWPQISVACFRYTGNDWLPGGIYTGYEIGETDTGPRPSTGTCVDDGLSGATDLGTFATWSVR